MNAYMEAAFVSGGRLLYRFRYVGNRVFQENVQAPSFSSNVFDVYIGLCRSVKLFDIVKQRFLILHDQKKFILSSTAMTSGFAFQTIKDDIHSIAEQDPIPLRAPAAPLNDLTHKVSSSSLCELSKPALHPSHAKLTSLASWPESLSVAAFCRNAANIADGAFQDDINKYGVFSDRSPLIDYSFHQDKNPSVTSSLPSDIISSPAEGPSIFYFASTCVIQKPLGVYPNHNCHDVENDHAIRSTQPLQQSFLISQIINSIIPMPEKAATSLPDLNVSVQKVDNPYREIPNCYSTSSKSSRQISMADDTISESGWTIYLNQSTDFTPGTSFADLSHSDSRSALHTTRNLRNLSAQHKKRCAGRNLRPNIEDSSMISDASSGPEQPVLYQDAEPCFKDLTFEKIAFGPEVSTGCKVDDLTDDACTSKVSCESSSNGQLPNIGWRMNKRRKRDLLLKPCPPLQNVTSNTRQIMAQVNRESNCNSFEGSGDNLHIETHTFPDISKTDEADLLDDRMEMLKRLIPNSGKLDREEVLAVVIDYVKSLELKIKMFEISRMDMADIRDEEAIESISKRAALAVGLESAAEGIALQERGLCLMPVSMFGKAL